MSIEKKWYVNQFVIWTTNCVKLEENLLEKELPRNIILYLGTSDLVKAAEEKGRVKFLGNKYLRYEDLELSSVEDAACHTYVDGKVPAWINLHYIGYDENSSYIRVLYCKDLVGKESKLFTMPSGNKQFRILLSTKEQISKHRAEGI